VSSTEELRLRHVGDMQRLMSHLTARLEWPVERLAEHRTTELRALLRTAVERSPWHRRRLAGIDIDRVGAHCLHDLPVMTKDDLMANFDEIVTDRRLDLASVEDHLAQLTGDAYLHGSYHAVASSGSSGRRGVFLYDWDAWAINYAADMRHEERAWMAAHPADRSVPMAAVAAGRPTHGSRAIFGSFSTPALRIHPFPVTNPVEQTVAGLNALQPFVLSGYPTALEGLARAARAGELTIQPARIITYGEPLLPEARQSIEDAFGTPICNWWCASEALGLAIGCGHGPWMHLSDDLLIVEPVDCSGQPVAVGERSAYVLLTNLYNRALPLIRYVLTDEVTLLEGSCPCGSTHRLVADVEGRSDDVFTYGEVRVHPHAFRSPLSRDRNIVEYQVRQTPAGAEVLVRCSGPVDLEGLSSEIAAGLRGLVAGPEVLVTRVETIPRQYSGKLKRFVALTGDRRPA
jgi:phenylacetate-coenzyme A ligase PaaK-like adenylate-forming protein